MKRTDSFIHDFKFVNIDITTNIDDNTMKSLTPPTVGFLDYYMNNQTDNSVSKSASPQTSGCLDYFMNRKLATLDQREPNVTTK